MQRLPPAVALTLLLASGARAAVPPGGEGAATPGASAPPGDRQAERAPSRAIPSRSGATDAGASATVLEDISGTVREVDRQAQRVVVDTGSERVTLSLDRNTMVYTPSGLGTVLDVRPGSQVRAGRSAGFLAYWIHVRGPAGAEPPSAAGQGTGPGGGAGPPASESGGAAPGGLPGSTGSTP